MSSPPIPDAAPAEAPVALPASRGGGAAAFAGGLRAALMLLTRFPVGAAPVSPAARAWAAAWFPLVGLGLGLLGAAVAWLAAPRVGGLLAAALALTAVLLATGALHEDGLADTADALGGARDRARLFAILKDSRVGAFGAIALVLSLLLRASALARLGPAAPVAFVLAQVVSRLPVVWLMASLPYVTPAEVARSADVASVRAAPLGLATLATAGLLALGVERALVPGRLALAAGVVALAAFALCYQRFRARAGGITGDFLGACQQITEVALLVTSAALLPG